MTRITKLRRGSIIHKRISTTYICNEVKNIILFYTSKDWTNRVTVGREKGLGKKLTHH